MMTLEEQWSALAAIPQPERRQVPWEDPELSGWVAFYRTLRDLFVCPGEFFANLGKGGWAEPLAFALIVSTVGLLFALFWHLVILMGGAAENTAGLVFSLDLRPAVLLGLMLAAPLLALFDLAVGGLCWWGSVALVGARREFTPAWRIFCYAHGILILGFIPLLGMLVAGIWALALLFIGTKEALGLSAWKSLGALAIFLAFQVALGIIVLLGLIAGLAGLGLLVLLG
jgi:hypothetical protein